MNEDPYTDEHGVLINRLKITSADRLLQAEADLRIFGSVYPWAGEIRSVSIARSERDVFCLPAYIESYASDVFKQLAGERYLRGLSRHTFIGRCAHYYAEVNALHPFREGNGRAQRSFFGQLARDAGWSIKWSDLDQQVNARASAAGLHGDVGPLTAMFTPLVDNRPIPDNSQSPAATPRPGQPS